MMALLKQANTAKKQSGFSLMEVLVTLIVLSIGLLGVITMQIASVKNANNAFYRQQATMLAEDMLDRMRANAGTVYTFGDADGGSDDCTYNIACGAGQIKNTDIFAWKQALTDAQLPNAQGSVALAGSIYTITITWSSLAKNSMSGLSLTSGSANDGTFVMKAKL